eukprot:TRINITY_DN15518_c0_g1_i1.p1 TRINITY_DN15518_c0_g1~~TRINITY_DN15518_c0_g1_i1.p1  ORF type:complete len:415 (+),score=215.39 TRINITY_DN15518_c0_g1_i1:66-1310(+)
MSGKGGNQMPSSNCRVYRNCREELLSPEELMHCDLQKVQEEYDALKEDNLLLEEELECFKRYHKRQQEQQMSGGRDIGEYGEDYGTGYSDGLMVGGRAKNQSKATKSSVPKGAELQLDDKQHIANSEIENMKKEKDKENKDMDRALEMIRASLEEAEVRIAETRKDSFDFNREIGDKNVVAEKILKYFDEKLKDKGRHCAKLRGKHSALKSQINKHEHQLKQREDMGEVLAPIDFDQLKIENQQFLERIEQKNKELVDLKVTTGNTVQTMNALTEKLNDFTQMQAVLRKDITSKKAQLDALKKSIQLVMVERETAERKFVQQRLQHEAVKVPKVEDYIQQKAELYELAKAAKNWTRKLEIADGQKKVIVQQLKLLKVQMEGPGSSKGPQMQAAPRPADTAGSAAAMAAMPPQEG